MSPLRETVPEHQELDVPASGSDDEAHEERSMVPTPAQVPVPTARTTLDQQLGVRPLPGEYEDVFFDVANYISVPKPELTGTDFDESAAEIPVGIDEVRAVLDRHGVTHCWLFGSRARGDHRADSDVDILVYREEGFLPGEMSRLKADLEQLFQLSADLNDSLMKRFVPYIYPDLVKLT